MPPMNLPATQIVLLSAPEDLEYARSLGKHLAPVEREKDIRIWHTGKTIPGANPAIEVRKRIKAAQLTLLLVSQDFLASDEIWGLLKDTLSQRPRILIPIIVRPCDWENSPISNLQPLPRNRTPISTWSNRDLGFLEVTREVREMLSHLSCQQRKLKLSAPWFLKVFLIALLGIFLSKSRQFWAICGHRSERSGGPDGSLSRTPTRSPRCRC